MKAAVVSSFDSAPRYQDFGVPVPAGDDELLVDVLAAGLHPRVRSQADGSHYTSTGALPLVPGVDGVGRGPDGLLRYFVLPDTAMGAMAERTVIDVRRSIVLPEGTDPVTVAAAMNPAMSSWVALRQRVSFQAGQDVLILGATADRLAKTAADVDVVLDYLWGQPAADAMIAIITSRADRSRPLSWIEIGSVAGPTAPVPSAALRAARLQLVGSGQGSVSIREYLAELSVLAQEIAAGAIAVDARPVPLADVEAAWAATNANHRIVLVP